MKQSKAEIEIAVLLEVLSNIENLLHASAWAYIADNMAIHAKHGIQMALDTVKISIENREVDGAE